MCLGIPMQVIAVDPQGMKARCTGRSGEVVIDTLLVGAVQPGDWVMTHLGAAREIVDAQRARLVGDALDALDVVLQDGESAASAAAIDAAFADLIGREPELPAHLRKPKPGDDA